MTDYPSKLFAKIRTRIEAQQLRAEMELLLNSLFEGDQRYAQIAKQVRSWVWAIMQEEMPQESSERKEYLDRIINQIDTLELLELTLAFEPSEKTLSEIFSYIQQSTGPGVILDLHLDRTILAGIKISFRGLYRDFSLIQQFDERFANLVSEKNQQALSRQ